MPAFFFMPERENRMEDGTPPGTVCIVWGTDLLIRRVAYDCFTPY